MASSTVREIARDFAWLSVARAAALATGLARSLIIPGLLGPRSYGIWKTLGLIQTYAQFGDAGARAALKRQIPLHAGRGDSEGLERSRAVAFLANNAAVLAAAALTVVAAMMVDDPAMRAALLLFLPLLYASHVGSFLEQLLAGLKEFSFLSRLSVAAGLAEAALAIAATWAFGLKGLIAGTAVAHAGAALVQAARTGWAVGVRWDRREMRELASIGFPSHLNGLLYNLFLSIDRWLILSFLGLSALGQYGLAMTICESLFQLSYAFGSVLSPRLVERYSERESAEDLRLMVEVPLVIISRAAPLVLGVVFFLSEAAVTRFLPAFTEAIAPLQVLLVGTFFWCVPRGLSSFFITMRRQAGTVWLYLAVIAINAGTVWWLLRSGWGLTGAALGTTLALAVYGCGLVLLAMRHYLRGRALAAFLVSLLWPLLLGAVLVAVCRTAAGLIPAGAGAPARLAAGALLFAVSYAPVPLALYRSSRASPRQPA